MQDPRPRLDFGTRRWRAARLCGGIALILASVAMVVMVMPNLRLLPGPILYPAGVGVALLLTITSGSLVFDRATSELIITHDRLLAPKRIRLPRNDIAGLRVQSIPRPERLRTQHRRPYVELVLLRTTGEPIRLLVGATPEKLEASRSAVADFLAEHDLLPNAPTATATQDAEQMRIADELRIEDPAPAVVDENAIERVASEAAQLRSRV